MYVLNSVPQKPFVYKSQLFVYKIWSCRGRLRCSVAIFADLSETGRFFTLAADKNFGFQMQIFGSKMAKIGRFLVMKKI